MDLELMRSFLSVVDHGGVGEAASALALTQSGLSRRLSRLEEDIGADLLVRDGRGVALTEMGRLVEKEARALTEHMARLKEDVARHVRLEAGVVRVGGGATAVSYLLPSAIARFRRAHPEVRFFVREAGSQEVARAVVQERLELGIVTLPQTETELSVTPLFEDKIVLICGRGHEFFRKKRLLVEHLQGQRLVGFEAGSKIRDLIDQSLKQRDVSMNIVMELRSIAAIVRMVETTGALAFVSELGAPRARVLKVSGLRIERRLALVQKHNRPLSPAALAFKEALLQQRPAT